MAQLDLVFTNHAAFPDAELRLFALTTAFSSDVTKRDCWANSGTLLIMARANAVACHLWDAWFNVSMSRSAHHSEEPAMLDVWCWPMPS
jgi:hypothetical protein